MKLTSSDILRLYGKKLFVLEGMDMPAIKEEEVNVSEPDETAKIEEEVGLVEEPQKQEFSPKLEPVEETKEEPVKIDLSRFTSGTPIIWKMKPKAQIALILHKSEFGNRELTGLLKASLVKAGIDPSFVGFGVIDNESQKLNLEDMSVNLALICDKLGGGLANPVDLSGKKLWLVPRLSELAANPEKGETLDGAMAGLAASLREEANNPANFALALAPEFWVSHFFTKNPLPLRQTNLCANFSLVLIIVIN